MPFCPTCHWEYVEGTKNCSDCGTPLVDELEVEKFPDDIETAECFVADDEIEAEIVKGILHQNNIPCILTSQYSHLVHPFSHIGASGEVGILVPATMHDESIHIIKEYQAQKGVIDEINDMEDDEEFDPYNDVDEELDDMDDLHEYDEDDPDLLDDDDEY